MNNGRQCTKFHYYFADVVIVYISILTHLIQDYCTCPFQNFFARSFDPSPHSYIQCEVFLEIEFSSFYRVRRKSENRHDYAPCIHTNIFIYTHTVPLYKCSRVDWFGRVKMNARRQFPLRNSWPKATQGSPKIISVRPEGTEVLPSSVLLYSI